MWRNWILGFLLVFITMTGYSQTEKWNLNETIQAPKLKRSEIILGLKNYFTENQFTLTKEDSQNGVIEGFGQLPVKHAGTNGTVKFQLSVRAGAEKYAVACHNFVFHSEKTPNLGESLDEKTPSCCPQPMWDDFHRQTEKGVKMLFRGLNAQTAQLTKSKQSAGSK